jgi:hypothetical protein
MSSWTRRLIILGSLFAVVLALALVFAFSGTAGTAVAQTQPTATTAPTPMPTPTIVVPFVDQWKASPHNDVESEAFAHWNEEEPAVVEEACAACHSGVGYVDFLGGDRSAAGVVNRAPAVGTTVTCAACHSQAASNLSAVTFLSTVVDEEGEEQPVVVSGLGPEARCMVCHQGRATKTQVDAAIARFEAEDALDDVVEPIAGTNGQTQSFGFINIHYYAAAVTLYGNQVHGGYEYDGMAYDAKNNHVPEFDTCVECHDPHTTQVRVSECAECHAGKTTVESLRTIREVSSSSDYDGDGNIREGMAAELEGLQAILLETIQSYAAEVAEVGIVYNEAAHPYWFTDADGDGEVDKNAEGANVRYTTFTPRLMKAAYNYQLSLKDPGAFAHGNKYIVQLLHDSIQDLAGQLDEAPEAVATIERDDAGHFKGNSEAFRHWDAEGMTVPGSCARCHSAAGLPQFVANGANIAVPASNGFQCTTCHTGEAFPTAANQQLIAVEAVPFPSGARLGFGEEGEADPSNLCLECHQGRESKASVDRAIGDLDDDEASEALRFRNVHYFVAGATLFGDEAKGIYQYDGKEYLGRFMHVEQADTCAECHDAHVLEINPQDCAGCHRNAPLEEIRMGSTEDYDGDGDVDEGLFGEVETMKEVLYEAIQGYAEDTLESGIVYNTAAYPYWFLDADNDGEADTNENGGSVAFTSFSPRLLKAAYNLQYVNKDPGAFAHNGLYTIQVLYDTIEDLNADLVEDMVRPAVEAE